MQKYDTMARSTHKQDTVVKQAVNTQSLIKQTRHTSSVVVDTSLGQHGVVLQFRLSQRRAVVGDDDQLGCKVKDQF